MQQEQPVTLRVSRHVPMARIHHQSLSRRLLAPMPPMTIASTAWRLAKFPTRRRRSQLAVTIANRRAMCVYRVARCKRPIASYCFASHSIPDLHHAIPNHRYAIPNLYPVDIVHPQSSFLISHLSTCNSTMAMTMTMTRTWHSMTSAPLAGRSAPHVADEDDDLRSPVDDQSESVRRMLIESGR
jgi:hypothetical protein